MLPIKALTFLLQRQELAMLLVVETGEDRIVPDVMRSLAAGEPVQVRNPAATGLGNMF